jgi:uncharacterized protein YcbK (DUF882 family)
MRRRAWQLRVGLVTVAAFAFTATPSGAEQYERFFVMGDGTLAVRNAHTGEQAKVRYRINDGSYDPAALAAIRRLFRSRTDQAEADVSLRLIEILSSVQSRARATELVLVSGYRSPALNESLRAKGVRAAGGSLHTEGLAADVAIEGANLRQLWVELRELECCGVGLYEHDRFVHIDVGHPRFWEPATSRVEENLSAENARVFARTDFDRYREGEAIELRVHSITSPPIAVACDARLISDQGARGTLSVRLAAEGAGSGSAEAAACKCIEVETGDRLLARGARSAASAAHIELTTCEPRRGRTPATIDSNPIEIR